MNLLPIPALDGGHIVLYGVEVVLGRRVKPAVVYRIQTIGVSVLILLAISVTLSDIVFLAGQR
jgi:regulator of sigma E protease